MSKSIAIGISVLAWVLMAGLYLNPAPSWAGEMKKMETPMKKEIKKMEPSMAGEKKMAPAMKKEMKKVEPAMAGEKKMGSAMKKEVKKMEPGMKKEMKKMAPAMEKEKGMK